jgi:predicted MFS family arabinose efflux permease
MSFAEVDADPARGVRGKPTNVRYLVLAGMTASVVVAYLTRSALAPAGSLIQAELHLSNTAMGQVLGVWALGYVCFQLPGGWVGDRLGRRVTLPIYAMGWSVCTLATATATSYAGMWWSRLIFGMAQGGLIPCLTRSCIDWFPAEHRGTASAWINAGMSAGAVAATALAAAMLPALGWRLTMQLFALAGIAWAAGFWITFRDRPEQHPKVNSAELALIRGEADFFDPINTKPCPSLSEQSPARSEPGVAEWANHLGVYGSPAFVLLNTQAFCRAFGYAFLISWFPLYLTRAHGIHLAGASVMTTLPLAGYATGAMVGGALVDRLLRRTGSKWWSRSAVGATSLCLAGLAPLLAVFATRPAAALAILASGALVAGLAGPATWAATMDLGGKSSTSVMAVLNMSGNVGAFLCPVAVGQILDAFPERWGLVLLMFAVVYIIGGICWLLTNTGEPTPRKHVAQD